MLALSKDEVGKSSQRRALTMKSFYSLKGVFVFFKDLVDVDKS